MTRHARDRSRRARRLLEVVPWLVKAAGDNSSDRGQSCYSVKLVCVLCFEVASKEVCVIS